MGEIIHDAIVVTGWEKEKVQEARAIAKDLIGHVSEVVSSPVNGYCSFFIAPDGSKEWWADSDNGDVLRDDFCQWIRQQAYEDGSNLFEVVSVRYGEIDAPEVTEIA